MKLLIATALLGTAGVAAAQTAPMAHDASHAMQREAARGGDVTRSDYLARAEARFTQLDADRNGVLTAAERRAGHQGRRGRRGGMGGPFEAVGQDGAPPPPPGAGRRGGGMGFGRADTDGDRRISLAEFAAQSAERFQRLDSNGDGTVDQAEIAARPGRRMMAGADTGPLTRAAFDAQAAERFRRMDANGDGYLDAGERPAGPRGRRGAMAAPAPTTVN